MIILEIRKQKGRTFNRHLELAPTSTLNLENK